jgi:hypothetical protein
VSTIGQRSVQSRLCPVDDEARSAQTRDVNELVGYSPRRAFSRKALAVRGAKFLVAFAVILSSPSVVSQPAVATTPPKLAEIAEISSSGSAQMDALGYAVAISGPVAVAGAPDVGKKPVGAAYVYVHVGRSWHRTELRNPKPNAVTFFGFAVAVSGTTVMIGSVSSEKIGYVFVYSQTGRSWKLSAIIRSPHREGYSSTFGQSVALDATTAVIGDPAGNDDTGRAYVYARRGKVWRLQATLGDPDVTIGTLLGTSVAISGSTVILGGNIPNVVAFVRRGTKWFRQATLGSNPGSGGPSIAISGNTAIVGRPIWDSGHGAVFVFTRLGREWRETARIVAPHSTKADYFGMPTAFSGDRLVVGAPNKGTHRCGTAFVYGRTRDAWREREEIANPGCAASDDFGSAVALSGTTAVIGAQGKNDSAGAVYVLTVP